MSATGTQRESACLPRIVFAGCCAAISFLLFGCAHTAPIPSPRIQSALVDPLPLTVAVYYSDSLVAWNEVVHEYGDTLSFPLGQPSVKWLSLALGANVQRLVVLDHPATAVDLEQQGVDALLVLSPDTFSFSLTHKFRVSYRLALSSRDGAAIAAWTVHGQFDLSDYNKRRPLSETWSELGHATVNTWGVVGEQVGLAIRDAAAHLAVGLREEPAVRQWLDARQSYRPLVGASDKKLAVTKFSEGGPLLLVSDDGDALRCMRHALESQTPPIRATSPWDMRDSLFPWFESEDIAPQGAETAAKRLRTIAQSEHGSSRLQEIALRYVIELTRHSESSEHGFILGLDGFGFWGVTWGDQKEALNAALGDLSDITISDVSARREAKFAVPALGLPIPLMVIPFLQQRTEREACQALGSAIADRLQSIGSQPKQ